MASDNLMARPTLKEAVETAAKLAREAELCMDNPAKVEQLTNLGHLWLGIGSFLTESGYGDS